MLIFISISFEVNICFSRSAERGAATNEKELSNPQKITCIIFENLFGSYFLPHQSHSYGYAPSSGENLTSKILFKSDATDYFHITKNR
ncbi:MAG: hypothetical protein PUB84_08440 [Bacteroidales bacterium]|nr:hypothetical protein [Bacteroidales bacterium]